MRVTILSPWFSLLQLRQTHPRCTAQIIQAMSLFAEGILNTHWDQSVPVNLAHIAKAMGIAVAVGDTGAACAVLDISRQRKARITINATHSFMRQRYGVAHAMGHSFGALFKKPHGRCVSLFLPYITEFTVNAGLGRYGDIARFAHLMDGDDNEMGGRLLVEKIRGLQAAVGQPASIAAFGVSREEFTEQLELLCDYAEMDTQFFTAPRIPEREELQRMFEYIYDGKAIDF